MKRKNKGFTLMELLAAVSILLVLMSLGNLGLKKISESLSETKLNEMAKIIYVTAQNNLSKLNNADSVNQLEYEENDGNMKMQETKPSDFDQSFPDENIRNYEDYKLTAIYSNSSKMKLLVPDKSLDATGKWIIEYDTKNANVYAVFYFEDEDIDFDFYSPISDLYEYRNGEKNVGYYGGFEKDSTVASTSKITSNLYVSNGEELKVEFTINLPAGHKDDNISAVVQIEGMTSGIISREIELGNEELVERKDGVLCYELVLDRLDKSFMENEDFRSSNNETLLAGEDIEITLQVKDLTDSTVALNRNSTITNMLYASLKSEDKTNTIEVQYIRHLQNLNRYELEKPLNVVQIRDLDFNDYHKNEFKNLYPDWIFDPIENTHIESYDGQGYWISNLNIGKTIALEDAGLFSVFYGKTLSNITMVNACASSSKSAGTIAGVVNSSSVQIKNCYSYLTTAFIEGKNTSEIRSVNGAVSGGLVGEIKAGSSVEIGDSFAANVLYGSNTVGGLIGKISGKAIITNSYADCYLESNGGSAGGLIGKTDSSLNITDCYAAGFVLGSESLFGGLTASIANIENSYSVISTVKANISEGYGLAYENSVMKNAYYLAMKGLTGGGTSADAKTMKEFSSSSFSNNKETVTYHLVEETRDTTQYPYPTLKNIQTINEKHSLSNHYGDWMSLAKITLKKNNLELNLYTYTEEKKDVQDTVELSYVDVNGEAKTLSESEVKYEFSSSGSSASEYVKVTYSEGELTVVGLKDTSSLSGGVETISVYSGALFTKDTLTVKVSGAPVLKVEEDQPNVLLYENAYIEGANIKTYTLKLMDGKSKALDTEPVSFVLTDKDNLLEKYEVTRISEGVFTLKITAKDDLDASYIVRSGSITIQCKEVLSTNNITLSDSNTVDLSITVYPVVSEVTVRYFDGTNELHSDNVSFNGDYTVSYTMQECQLNGRTFKGWKDEKGNTITSYTGLKQNQNLYADFEE